MRRTFKAYDEGGTGLLSVADFRKVSSALGCLSCLNGEQWPNASGQTSKEDPSLPWGRPRCEWLSGTSFPWGPQVIPCPSPADPRFSSLKVSRTLGGTRPEPSGHHSRCHWSLEPRLGPTQGWTRGLLGGAGVCICLARPPEQELNKAGPQLWDLSQQRPTLPPGSLWPPSPPSCPPRGASHSPQQRAQPSPRTVHAGASDAPTGVCGTLRTQGPRGTPHRGKASDRRHIPPRPKKWAALKGESELPPSESPRTR